MVVKDEGGHGPRYLITRLESLRVQCEITPGRHNPLDIDIDLLLKLHVEVKDKMHFTTYERCLHPHTPKVFILLTQTP